jgi:capsular polysaccharide transport system permease protein
LPILDQQIAAFENQISDERSRTAGEDDSLAPKVATYEQLSLDRELSAKALESAMAGLEAARLDASRQQVFIYRVVNPTEPDKAAEPDRLKMIFMIVVSSLIAYSILALVIAGMREHQQK